MLERFRQRVRGLLARQSTRELGRFVVLPFFAQRAVLLCAVYFTSFLVSTEEVEWRALPRAPLFDGWVRWDSYYYMLIAVEGYAPTQWGNANTFFPLYPWLIRLLSPVMPVPVAALVVTHLATLIGLCLLYLIARRLHDEALARRTVWAALLFPSAYFFSAAYSESTYLAVAAGAFLAWLCGRRLTAAALAAAATLARPVGAFCFSISFVVGWLVRRRWRELPLIAGGPVLGAGIFALVHRLSSGSALAPFRVPRGALFGDPVGAQRSAAPWWAVLADEGQSKTLMLRLLNWGALALAGGAGGDLLRRRQIELALITWLSMLVPLIAQRTLFDAFSMARFALSAFPLFIVLARWAGDGDRGRVLGVAGAMLQLALAVCFATWRWAE